MPPITNKPPFHRIFLLFLLAIFSLVSSAARSLHDIPVAFASEGNAYVTNALNHSIEISPGEIAVTSRHSRAAIHFEHANAQARIEPSGDAGTENLFIGQDPSLWKTGIPLFQRVHIKGIYKGIDVVYHGRDSELEYDWVISPGADPRAIQMKLNGPGSLNAAGDLALTTADGVFTEMHPVAYQTILGTRHRVTARFVLSSHHRLRFALGTYDRSTPLIIDPVIFYSSYLGSTTTEAHATAVDANGNFYIAGTTVRNGVQNVLLFKIPPSGSPTLSVFGGTAGTSTANAIVTDAGGNVYLAGATSSGSFPMGPFPLTIQNSFVGTQKAFVMSLTPDNSAFRFSAFFGGSLSDEAWGLALGPNDLLYITGDTNSPDFLMNSEGAYVSQLAFQVNNHGGYDGFLVSISTSGVFNYATYIGGAADDHAYAVTVDSNNYAYVAGTTASSNFPSGAAPGSYVLQNTLNGTANAFAIKIRPDGQKAYWSTYLGGESSDAANAIALDSTGNVYIAGTTGSTKFPVTTGAYQTTYQGGASDGFIAALTNTGQGLWSSYLGSPGSDAINGLALDTAGNVIVTGATDSTAFPITSDAVQVKNFGAQDAFVARLSNSGASLLFSTYFGGSGNDTGTAVTVDNTNNIYLTGITTSSNNDFPVTTNAYQTTYGGGNTNAFFAILGCPTTLPAIGSGGVVNAASYSLAAIAPGGAIAIFGTNLACTAAGALSLPLPTTLSGVSVQVNGTKIPLFYVSSTQINAQLPYEIPTGTATLTVTGPGGTSAAYSLPVIAAGPGIFAVNSHAAALNSDATVNSASNGAKGGSYVSVYFTGQGAVNPPVATGAAAPAAPLSYAPMPWNATIGGQPVTVYFLGLAPGFAGLGQANLQVPKLSAGDYPVILTINGVASVAASITISD